ncbi:MAG TPA: anaerobic ribonucleoside-triphosphate reductase activating protein [Clostridiaceae bacterium]|nr:anaerobic ribonucleoside-triphosphate reductase activating protein [Clostridiaceae bacterium]
MKTTLRIAGIVKESIVDGPGIRLVVFAQGCKRRCPGCHNPQTHPFDGGKIININEILEMIDRNPLIDGITLSGGEPFEQAEAFAVLAEKVKEKGLNVMTYTGYTFEEIMKNLNTKAGWERLLKASDILVDGRFIQEERDLTLKFRGSKNQRIIDVKKSIENNRVEIILI